MRIVYVEDNQANVFLVRRIARAGGHDVINYIDGEEALVNIVKDDPNLILMDVQLAGEMSGLQVVEKLRSDGYQMPIVAVTAYAMVGDRERCMQAGCNDYIAKPLSIPRLLELIDYYNENGKKVNGVSTPAAAPEAPTEIPKSEPVAAPPADKVEVAAENKPVTEPTQPATPPVESVAATSTVPAAPAATAEPAAPETPAAVDVTTPEDAKTPAAPTVSEVTNATAAPEKAEKSEAPAAATSQESQPEETAPSNV